MQQFPLFPGAKGTQMGSMIILTQYSVNTQASSSFYSFTLLDICPLSNKKQILRLKKKKLIFI